MATSGLSRRSWALKPDLFLAPFWIEVLFDWGAQLGGPGPSKAPAPPGFTRFSARPFKLGCESRDVLALVGLVSQKGKKHPNLREFLGFFWALLLAILGPFWPESGQSDLKIGLLVSFSYILHQYGPIWTEIRPFPAIFVFLYIC